MFSLSDSIRTRDSTTHGAPSHTTDVAGDSGLVQARIHGADSRRTNSGRNTRPGSANTRRDTDTGRADADVARGAGLIQPRIGSGIAGRTRLIDAPVAGDRRAGRRHRHRRNQCCPNPTAKSIAHRTSPLARHGCATTYTRLLPWNAAR
jgi:hypothetical protein